MQKCKTSEAAGQQVQGMSGTSQGAAQDIDRRTWSRHADRRGKDGAPDTRSGSASSTAEYTESDPAQPMARLATSAKEGTISHQSAAQGHVKEQISEAQEQCTSWRRKIPRPLMKMDTGL